MYSSPGVWGAIPAGLAARPRSSPRSLSAKHRFSRKEIGHAPFPRSLRCAPRGSDRSRPCSPRAPRRLRTRSPSPPPPRPRRRPRSRPPSTSSRPAEIADRQAVAGGRPAAHDPRPRARPGRVAPARRPRSSRAAPTRATPWCCGTASSSTTPISAASTGRRSSTDGVERIEVVRGPYLGALRLERARRRRPARHPARRRATARVLGDVRLEGGSNDYLRGGVAAGRRFGALAVDLSGHLRRGEGEVANDFYDGEEIDLALDGASRRCRDARRAGALGGERRRHSLRLCRPAARRREQSFDDDLDRGAVRLDRRPLAPRRAGGDDRDRPRGAAIPTIRSRRAAPRPAATRPASSCGGASATSSRRPAGGDWDRQEVRTRDAFGPGLADETPAHLGGLRTARLEPWSAARRRRSAPRRQRRLRRRDQRQGGSRLGGLRCLAAARDLRRSLSRPVARRPLLSRILEPRARARELAELRGRGRRRAAVPGARRWRCSRTISTT